MGDSQSGLEVADYQTWGELPDGAFHRLEAGELERIERCPVCDGSELRVLGDVATPDAGVVLSTAVCVGCGFVFRDVRPKFSWFESAWALRVDTAPAFHDQDQAKQASRHQRYSNTAHLLEEVGAGRTMLDVGSGPGYGLAAFAERGWSVRGIEPDDGRARIGREQLGLDVRTQPAESLGRDGDLIEVVTMIHVFEHMRDISAVVGACAAALVEGGHLYIEVPDAFTNLNWGDLTHIEHLSYFNEWTLQRVAARHGLVGRHRAFPRTKPWGNRHLGLVFQKTSEATRLATPSPIDADPYTHYAGLLRSGLGHESTLGDPIHFIIAGVADSAVMVRDRIVVPSGRQNTFVVHSNPGGQVFSRESQPLHRRLMRPFKALPDTEPIDTALRKTVNKVARRKLLGDPGFMRIQHRPI